jgi:hypothetical protein
MPYKPLESEHASVQRYALVAAYETKEILEKALAKWAPDQIRLS